MLLQLRSATSAPQHCGSSHGMFFLPAGHAPTQPTTAALPPITVHRRPLGPLPHITTHYRPLPPIQPANNNVLTPQHYSKLQQIKNRSSLDYRCIITIMCFNSRSPCWPVAQAHSRQRCARVLGSGPSLDLLCPGPGISWP